MLQNKYYLIGIFLLVFSSSVSASTPTFNILDNIDSELTLGENEAGNLVFVESQYLPNFHDITNYSTKQVQRYDRIRWLINNSATITSPTGTQNVLTQGTEYLVTEQGNYQVQGLTNASNQFTLVSSAANLNTITLNKQTIPNGFDIQFSQDSFILQNERVINVDVEVDDDVLPGNYNFIYQVNNQTRTKTFSVEEVHDWEIINQTVNETIDAKVGDNKYLGYLLIRNLGNVDVEVKTQKKGNSTFLISAPQPFTLYKKTEGRIDLQLQVPTTQKPGIYNIDLFVNTTKKNQTFSYKVVVTDAIKPNIESINFSTDRAYRENKISVIATDNNAVANVTLNYDNKVVVFDKDQQLFTKTVTFDKLSRYVMTFCAYDFDGNEKCTNVNRTFVRSNIISDYKNNIVLPTKKIGKYSEIEIFNLSEDVPEGIKVELVEFVPIGSQVAEGSNSIRIVDGDGAIKTINSLDREVEVNKAGIIKLEIRSEEIADFNGLLRFNIPSYINSLSDLNFKVSFKDYDIPEDFNKAWIGGRDLECQVVDTGDLSTSYYNCEIEFPIDTRPEEISVPTTVAERDNFKAEADIVQERLDKKETQFAIFVTLLSIFIILLVIAIWFLISYYPYVRFTSGHKLKERYGGS